MFLVQIHLFGTWSSYSAHDDNGHPIVRITLLQFIWRYHSYIEEMKYLDKEQRRADNKLACLQSPLKRFGIGRKLTYTPLSDGSWMLNLKWQDV